MTRLRVPASSGSFHGSFFRVQMSDWDACLFVGWFVVDFGLRYAQSIGCGGNGIRTMNALFIFYYKSVVCLYLTS